MNCVLVQQVILRGMRPELLAQYLSRHELGDPSLSHMFAPVPG